MAVGRITKRERKAARSAAAKKGWETRIARERREIEEATNALIAYANRWPPLNAPVAVPDPNPWPGVAAFLRREVLRVVAWFR